VSVPLEDDLAICLDHSTRLDPWFRMHFVFAPADQRNQVAGLHALFAMLERTLQMSEESLVLAQLAWWREELQPERAGVSAHPVIRVLRNRNDQALPSTKMTDHLIAPMLERLQAEPLSDKPALKALCDRIGSPRVCLQLGVDASEQDESVQSGCGSVSGLIYLIDTALRTPDKPWWFLPLSIQAKHQVQVNSLGHSSQDVAVVLGSLLEWAAEWMEEQFTFFKEFDGRDGNLQNNARHLVAMNTSHLIRLARTRQDIEGGGTGVPGKWSFLDMYQLWSACRQLRGSKVRK